MAKKSGKSAKSPDKLAKTGKSGVQLTESELGKATGGFLKAPIKG